MSKKPFELNDQQIAAKTAVLAHVEKTDAGAQIGESAWGDYLSNIGSSQAEHDKVLTERTDFVTGAVAAHETLAIEAFQANTAREPFITVAPMGGKSATEIITSGAREVPDGIGENAGRKTVYGTTSVKVKLADIDAKAELNVKSKAGSIGKQMNESQTAIADAIAAALGANQ